MFEVASWVTFWWGFLCWLWKVQRKHLWRLAQEKDFRVKDPFWIFLFSHLSAKYVVVSGADGGVGTTYMHYPHPWTLPALFASSNIPLNTHSFVQKTTWVVQVWVPQLSWIPTKSIQNISLWNLISYPSNKLQNEIVRLW